MLISSTSILYTSLLCLCLQYNLCVARDTITAATPLLSEKGNYISSAGNKFRLGFFTPKSGNYHYHGYIGIWYSMDAETIIWVANRHLPVSVDSTKNVTGVFTVEEDGNLKLLDSNQDSNYFSTNLNISGSSSRTAKLLDTGNLVLLDDQTGKMLWESFDNPTDTFLPGMKMHKNLKLYSWLDTGNDPNYGKYWFEQDKDDNKGYLILKMDTRGNLEGDKKGDLIKIRKRVYWRSGGSASSFNPSKMFGYASQLLSNSAIDGDFSNSRLVMDSSGQIQFLSWDASTKLWVAKWSEPQRACSKYNFCGDFGSCTLNYETNSSSCNCLPGFEPTSPDYWKSREFYFSGCKRKSSIFCGKQSENDEFLNLKAIKVGNPNWPSLKVESEQACRVNCLGNCQCQAYAYINASSCNASIRGCWIWTQGVSDIQEGNTSNIYNLFIRVANDSYNASIHANATGHGWPTIPAFKGSHQKNKMSVSRILILISCITTFGMLLVCSLIYMSRKRLLTTGQVRMVDNTALVIASGMGAEGMMDQGLIRQDEGEGIDVPFFDLKSVLAATNNFSEANKLGQGGFGPVYKGKLFGREIAVKRLSVHSGQGLMEFKTEVVLIAKLQHRNLVRLLGYCIGGDEKILLYEYMPNKSLDAFLFDRTLCILLNWEKRFDIIMGVTRGLLYLHQDSRLRIIHRDMKASNILLDQDMKPKISDFGLARIVRGKETEASTNRVIGTFGYMSPEYALDGQFSIKSDVFSFGVVLLEIVSGRRNTGFYKSQLAWNLISYAWSLWKDEKALCLLDPRLEEECNGSEVVKCITIGLLCVQEDPRDRPTVSKVLFMLGSEISTLPNPKEPAFVSRKLVSGPTSSSASCEITI